MVYDQAQSPRLGQRTSVESTYVQIFDVDPSTPTADLVEAAWTGMLIFRNDLGILQIYNGDAGAWQDIAGGVAGQLTYVGTDFPTGSDFTLGSLFYDSDDGYTQYVWNGTSWQPSSMSADYVTSGQFKEEIRLGARLVSTIGAHGERVEIDEDGLRVYAPSTTGTDGLLVTFLRSDATAQFTGTATIDNLVTTLSSTQRGTVQLSRNGVHTLNYGVTAPGIAPAVNVDWQPVPLTGYDFTGQNIIGLQWDTTTSRWLVAVNTGTQCQIMKFTTAGAYDGLIGNVQTTSGLPYIAACRAPLETDIANFYLLVYNSSFTLINGRNDSGAFYQPPTYWPNSYSSSYAMCYDDTTNNLVIGEFRTIAGTPYIELQRWAVFSAGTNLISNSTFNTNLSGWSVPSNPGAPTISRVTGSDAITGAGSMQIASIGSTGFGPQCTQFSVTGRRRYLVSADAYAKTGGGKQFSVGVYFYNAAGSQISGTSQDTRTISGSVQTWSAFVTAPPTAVTAAVFFSPAGAGNYVVDNVSIATAAGLNFVSLEQVEMLSAQTTPANAIYVGSGDFGSRYFVGGSATSGGNLGLVASDPSGPTSTTETTNLTFPLPPGAVKGIGYDGTSFWSLIGTTLYKHEGGNKFTTEPSKWWAATTYADTANHYETGLSPATSFTMKRRARVTLTGTPINTTGTSDPTSIGYYLDRNNTAPASSAYNIQGNSSSTTFVVTAANFTSAAPNTGTTGFPNASPALLRSAAESPVTDPLIQFWGDGTWRLGDLHGAADGSVSGGGLGIAGGDPPVVQVFTSSGTWTKPANAVYVVVEVQGGGGTGASASVPSTGNISMGSGGGGGGYVRKTYAASALNSTEAVVVGAVTASPAAGNHDGIAGNASTFKGLTANGGGGGNSMNDVSNSTVTPGAGGTATGGDVNIAGGNGETARVQNPGTGSVSVGSSSLGGGSFMAGFARSPTGTGGGDGGSGRGFGGGGAGAYVRSTGANQQGGSGAAGLVVVTTYFGGAQGVPGAGVPTGGAAGAMLYKNSTTDYDDAWGVPGGDLTGSWPNPTLITKTFNFAVASTTWTCTHNLGKLGAKCFTTDLSGSEIRGDVVHTSVNVITINWVSATTGVAYITP